MTLPGEAVLSTIQEHGVEDWMTPPRIGHEKPPTLERRLGELVARDKIISPETA